MEQTKSMFTIKVYLSDRFGGVVRQYSFDGTPESAREHAAAIGLGGYRQNDGEGNFVFYPPHQILKVKVTGASIPTNYPDTGSGT